MMVAAAAMILLSAGGKLLAGVDVPTWNAARKKFLKHFKNMEKLPDLIDELGDLNDQRAVEMLCKKTLFHDSFAIRVQAFEVLSRTTDEAAVMFLAEQVRRDKNNRLTYARLLQSLSGKGVVKNLQLALKDKRWEVVSAALEAARRHADESLKDTCKKKMQDKNYRIAYEAALAYKACGGELPEKFKLEEEGRIFPQKIFSAKCLLLFDNSDDMATTMALPEHAMNDVIKALKRTPKPADYEKHFVKTRQAFCASAAAKALATLEKGSQYNIALYSVGAAFWQRKFKKANPKDEKTVRKFLERMTHPARDLYDGLKGAMKVEGIDTVYIVACGLPANARVEDTERILSWLKKANYDRSIRINTSVVLSNYMEGKPTDEALLASKKANALVVDFYKRMAEENGGVFRLVADLGRVPVPSGTEKKEEKPEKKEPDKKEPEKKEPEKKEPEKKEPEKKEPEKPKPPKKDDGWLPRGK